MSLKSTLKGLLICFLVFFATNFLHAQKPVTNGKKDFSGGDTKINLASKTVDQSDLPSVIYLNAIHINAMSAENQNARRSINAFQGKQLHLVKFGSAIKPEWYKMLTDAGTEVVDYIPNYAYMVFGDYSSIQRLQMEAGKENSPIVWDGDYLPEYRISPDVYKAGANGLIDKNQMAGSRVLIQLYVNDEANRSTTNLINILKTAGTPVYEQGISHYINITASLTLDALTKISQQPDVISIHNYVDPKKNDESQDMIMTGNLVGNGPPTGNYLTYLASKGFTQAQFDASGFVVNLSDDGLDNGSTGGVLNITNHFGLYKTGNTANATRVAFIHPQGSSTDADTKGCDGHGNLNTHIVGGYVPDALLSNSFHTDANGFRYGLGVAPFVKVGNSTIFRIGGTYSNPNISNLEAESYRDGGRISSNSWGAAVNGAYDATAQTYDFLVRDAQRTGSSVPNPGNQEMVIFFSAGNSGANAGTIGSPGTGKNVITVGASEGVRTFGGSDGCGITDAQSNSANDIIFFSSRGPCTDGRVKPDIIAPGTKITGGVFPSSVGNSTAGSGTAAPCYNGSGVCGGTGGSIFFPSGQQWYTASSGTSHSTPATAGFGALVRQSFINKGLSPASPAMTKAVILNSAAYMNGTGANDNLFSNNQGMGRVDMTTYFNALGSPNLLLRDELPVDMFTASGQFYTTSGVVANPALPVRITLAWTDAPGPTSGNAYVNNLDLEVVINGVTYLGNVFTGALSSTGGTADTRDNVESVFLPAGTTGTYLVRVKATNIAGDGVPNVGGALDQDFSLIATNFSTAAVPVISAAGATITAESCAPANGVIDAGETVTVNFCLQNVGTQNTTNLVATLLPTGSVVAPSGPQTYGVLTAGGASVCKSFTFSNSALCGGTITATLQLQDGATNLGTVTYNFTVGNLVTTTVLSENFDGVAAPALPAGWVATQGVNVPGAPFWVTATGTAVSAPNSIFSPDPSNILDNLIETPTVAIPAGAGTKQISFQNNYNTESTFDGGVLEISINGGAYADIITAGGAFTAGGYSGTISTAFGSPIAGRQAWTGSSGGYITSTATLPAAATGQNVKFRFRMASDNSVGVTGWNVDNVTVSNAGFVCCGIPLPCILTCPANITTSNTANQCGAVVNYPAPTTSGACGTVTSTPASGSFFPVGTTTVTATSQSGASCQFTVTVNDTQAPTITCPGNQTRSTNNNVCTYTTVGTEFNATATDNCPGAITFAYTLTGATTGTGSTLAGVVFNKGITTVSWTAKDGVNNTSAPCTFTVTVNDNQNPVITCPANSTVTTPIGSCTAVVNYTVTASDNCPGVVTSLVSGLASGSAFPIGVNTVSWKATDASGNVSTCSFTVTVLDGQLPVITTQPVNKFVCVGSNATFSVIATNVVTYQWQAWNGSAWNNIAGANASTYTINNTTLAMNTNSYRVVINGLCTLGIISGYASLYVNALPTVSLLASRPPALTPGQSLDITAVANPGGGSYVWYKNGVVIAGASGSSLTGLTVDNIGTYKVVYTDLNGCVTTSADLVVSGLASDKLWVYPNPNRGIFQVRFYNAVNEPVTVTIYDSKGAKVYSNAVITTIPYTRIDVDLTGAKSEGTYLVEVVNSAGKKVGARKFVMYHP